MLIKAFTVGRVQTNCYIVTDENTLECAVIDPGAEAGTILRYIEENKLRCRRILLTHGHFDHTGAVEEVMKRTGAAVHMHKKDLRRAITEMGFKYAPPKGTAFFREGDTLTVGALAFEVIETPGHSEGSVCFRCGDALFSGDTLFKDSCGRTDFPGCNPQDMLRSLKKLYALPGDCEVYPGHMETTSLERERRFNPFMRQAADTL
ncbi:MAG: MBL fold metallo-hydrolase [Oscillospiraceae bacterium]|jgi:glyoxylase-like metal-dependent hydrolase (beta-lactamase superfamily II)|nr:MBL fold metallo-hydrolase [Oscillospiraceae bacterium]